MSCHVKTDQPSMHASGAVNLACIDCHMPYLAKSAVKVDAIADKPAIGDVSTHIFTINLTEADPQFTDTGSFAYPYITADWACRTCHNSAPGAVVFPFNDVSDYVFHNNIVD